MTGKHLLLARRHVLLIERLHGVHVEENQSDMRHEQDASEENEQS